MGSDKTRALLGFAKLLLAVVVGYAIAFVWSSTRGEADVAWFGDNAPYVPYAAGLVAALMVFVLLSKLSKGSGD
jgi:prepilin signal peptidase PulO-like enzyme (type II secretory pathway)